MKYLVKLYDALIVGLAVLAAASLAWTVFAIVVDVMLRNLGFRPFQATSALIEYVLLFSTMAGAPWLVRRHGHVAITSFVDQLPQRLRLGLGKAVIIVSVLCLALLAWRAGGVALERIEAGAVDMRSIDIPSWILYAMLSSGFALMAVESLRLLARGETYGGGDARH